jgi:acyl-CoA synthetase (AMP-forming)/AMP-acid ligase II
VHTIDGEGPYLRTGDLGFITDGDLYITGRLKDLIITRGRNIYPQDIESTVERTGPALRPGCSAAFGVDVAGEERVAIVSEIDGRLAVPPDWLQVIQAIVEAVVKAHDLRPESVTLIAPGTIPKTPSGKLQRRACKQMLAAGTLEVVAALPSPRA